MATELISAKDLPVTEAENVDVLCVDNGELKRRQAKGLGGTGNYVIRIPLSDVTVGEDGTTTVKLTESYDNFAQILYDGGHVVGDLSEAMQARETAPAGSVFYAPIMSWSWTPDDGLTGAAALGDSLYYFFAANGTWTPPEE